MLKEGYCGQGYQTQEVNRMKRLFGCILIIIFISATALAVTFNNTTGADYTNKESRASYRVQDSAVSIFMMGAFVGSCSGVVVKVDKGYTYVLTCKHCINVTEEMYVGRLKEQRVIAVFTASDDDLALLKVKGEIEGKAPAKLALFNEKVEKELYHVAYPNLVFKLYRVKGRVLRYTEDWGWALLTAQPGCSGGGIFNSEQELVGILWGGFGNITLFEPIEDVWKFLKEVEVF